MISLRETLIFDASIPQLLSASEPRSIVFWTAVWTADGVPFVSFGVDLDVIGTKAGEDQRYLRRGWLG